MSPTQASPGTDVDAANAKCTDAPPRDRGRADYVKSDGIKTLDLPATSTLPVRANRLERAMKSGTIADVRDVCADFLTTASHFYKSDLWHPRARGKAAASPGELENGIVRGTTIRKPCSSGCGCGRRCGKKSRRSARSEHAVPRSLPSPRFPAFPFSHSWHTRGFYERAAALYHHVRGTPQKRLFWVPMPGGRWRIDRPRTNRGA